MAYFNDVLIPFCALNVSVALLSMQGQKTLIDVIYKYKYR